MGAKKLQVFNDSQLLVNPTWREYQAKDASMAQYLVIAKQLIDKFHSCKLMQILMEQNSKADAIENIGSVLETKSQMSIPLLVLPWPAMEEETEPSYIWRKIPCPTIVMKA